MKKTLLIFTQFFIVSLFSFGQFVENKGQIHDVSGKYRHDVHFVIEFSDKNIFFTNQGIVHHYKEINPARFDLIASGRMENPYSNEEWEAIQYQLANDKYEGGDDKVTGREYRVDMTFPGADLTKAVGEEIERRKNNYFLPNKEVKDVAIYNRIRYIDVYPGIDLVFYKEGSLLKYDFIVSPNANPELIKILYKGIEGKTIDEEGNLIIKVLPGEIIEQTPISFQGEREVKTQFQLSGDTISFQLDHYDKNSSLIIDPALHWSTYFHDGGINANFTTSRPVWASDGSMFYALNTYNNTTFPTINPGGSAYYNITPGSTGLQLVIMKYNVDKEIVWATYYPSSQSSRINYSTNTIAIDHDDNIYVAGQLSFVYASPTPSFNLYNPGGGAYYQSNIGTGRNFILKFSIDGERLWATMMEPNTNSTGQSISGLEIDNQNRLVAVGYAYTPSSWGTIPLANPGGNHYYQGSPIESQVPILYRFNSNLSLNWGTYISQGVANSYNGGGEPGVVARIDDNDNIFLATNASSSTYTLVNPGGGAYQDNSAPTGRKISIFKFLADGSLYWNTLYGGETSANSILWQDPRDMTILSNGDVVIVGRSNCTDFPTFSTGSAYLKSTLSTGSTSVYDGVILQFTNNGVRKWATYYGGDGTSDGSDFWGVGKNSNDDIVIAGYSRTTSTFPIQTKTGSYNQSTQSGNQATVLCQFDKDGDRLWSTYFGHGTYNYCHGFAVKDLSTSAGSCGADGVYLMTGVINAGGSVPTINPGGSTYYQNAPEGTGQEDFIAEFIEGTIGGSESNTTSTNPICEDETKNLTTDGAGDGTWTIVSGGGSIIGSTYTPDNVSNPTSVTINYEDACGNIDDVTFTVNPMPSAPAAVTPQAFCGSATVADLTATGSNLQWYAVATGGLPLSSGTALTNGATYYVSQTVNGCESSRTGVQVTVNPIPSAPAAVTPQSFCGSATVADLTATGSNLQWYAAATGGSPLSSGTALTNGATYYVSQTVNGCESSRTGVQVTVNPIPSAPAAVTPQAFCGSATVADLIASGSSIQWYANSTGGSPLAGGTALVNGSTYYASQTVDGCESSRTAVTVTIATPPVAGTLSGNQTFCAGTSSAITNTGGDAGGTWSSDNTGVATVNSSGVVSGVSEGTTTITYTVLGTSGCPDATATIIVTVTPSVVPSVTISGDDVSGICAGSTVNLTASSTNGGTNPTYQWQINGVDVVGETGTTFSTTGLNEGDIVTVVMVSDDPCANPTTVSDNTVSVGIVANVTPSVSITGVPTEEVCAGESITFTANPTFGGANPTYQWQVNGTDVAGESGTTFTTSGLNDGDVVSVVMTSDDPCANPTVVTGTIGTEGISIGDSEAPVFSECPADITVSSGNSCDASVTWTAPTVTDNCTTTPTLTSTHNSGDNFPVGTTVVTYTAEDDEGNIGTCSFNIIVVDDEAPAIVSCISDAVLFSDASCETIVPDFTVDAQLEITDNCSSVADGTLTITQNPAAGTELGMGTHTVEITVEDAGGNTATCSFELVVSDTTAPVIDIDYSPAAIHCAGNEVTWTENITDNCGVETVTSTHQSGDTFPVGTTTVTYTATDASGNESTYSFDVVVGPSPNAPELSGNNFTVCYGKDITLSIDNYDNTNDYSWIHSGTVVGTGSTHEVESSQVEDAGIYTVTATSSEGCVSVTEVELSVNQCEIVISGGISPNGDGLNDVFEIGGIEAYPKTEVWIYNRWGTEVYHSEDYKNDWDGTSQSSLNVGGNELPEGTYYYVIRLGGYEGQLNAGETYKGYVYLKR